MRKGKKHGVGPSLGDMHVRLGLGTPPTLTRSDGCLPDNAQVWVRAETWLVRGISPTQSRQGSMAHEGFPVSGVFLPRVLSIGLIQQRNMPSFFSCTEVTASLMRLKFNFSSSNNSFHLRLYEVTSMVSKPAHVSESPECAS